MSSAVSKEHQIAGQLAVLLTAFLWSTSGLFIKLLDWHPMVIVGIRGLISAVFILIMRMLFPSPAGAKNLPLPFWAGAIVYAGTIITFVIAVKITTAANAIILQYSAPVWAALLGWWLIKEKPHWEQWGAMVLVFVGLIIFLRNGLASGALLGDGLATLSGIFFAANCVFLRMMKDGNPRDCLLLSHAICAFIGIPFIFIYPPTMTVPSLLSVIYMGVVQLGLASIIYAYGIKRISAVQAMLTATLEPICSPIWVFLIIGEKPSILALLGGGIIIAAVVISSVIGKQREIQQ